MGLMMTATRVDAKACGSLSTELRLPNETAKQLRLHEPCQSARTPRREAFDIDATDAALFEWQRPPGTDQMSRELAKRRLVTDERDAASASTTRELGHHR